MWPFQRHPPTSYIAEAKELVRDICERHGLKYECDLEAPVELAIRIPRQPGLSIKIFVGLQNNDELNLGVGDFWSYFFPFDEKKEAFKEGLEGFVLGECRVVEYRRPGAAHAYKCRLEKHTSHGWETLYAHATLFGWSRKPQITYIVNEAAAQR